MLSNFSSVTLLVNDCFRACTIYDYAVVTNILFLVLGFSSISCVLWHRQALNANSKSCFYIFICLCPSSSARWWQWSSNTDDKVHGLVKRHICLYFYLKICIYLKYVNCFSALKFVLFYLTLLKIFRMKSVQIFPLQLCASFQ